MRLFADYYLGSASVAGRLNTERQIAQRLAAFPQSSFRSAWLSPIDTEPNVPPRQNRFSGSPAALGILRAVDWITLFLALYGAVLSSVLGFLAWRRDRHSLRFFATHSRRSDWYGLQLSVVNVGFRPVILESISFEQADGSGYLNQLDGGPHFPFRLDEGEQVVLGFHCEDIEPNTTAFVVRDTHRRQHRFEFTPEVRDTFHGFQEFVEETEPALAAKGRERPAALMRRLSANDPAPE